MQHRWLYREIGNSDSLAKTLGCPEAQPGSKSKRKSRSQRKRKKRIRKMQEVKQGEAAQHERGTEKLHDIRDVGQPTSAANSGTHPTLHFGKACPSKVRTCSQ